MAYAGHVTAESDDAVLLAACAEGDGDAWTLLVGRHQRLVYSVARSSRLSAEDAADVTQLVFAELLKGLGRIEDPSRLNSWLATVARRQSWRVASRVRREPPVDPTLLDTPDSDDAIARTEGVVWLIGAMQALEPRCRELLTALYLDTTEPSYAEVAAHLGRPIGSIGPTRARCLERLRHLLDPPVESAGV